MSKQVKAVEFAAELRQIKSRASDHTYDIVLNVPEYNTEQVKIMLDKLLGMVKIVMEFQD